jgi:hypothetical protein
MSMSSAPFCSASYSFRHRVDKVRDKVRDKGTAGGTLAYDRSRREGAVLDKVHEVVLGGGMGLTG